MMKRHDKLDCQPFFLQNRQRCPLLWFIETYDGTQAISFCSCLLRWLRIKGSGIVLEQVKAKMNFVQDIRSWPSSAPHCSYRRGGKLQIMKLHANLLECIDINSLDVGGIRREVYRQNEHGRDLNILSS